MSQVGVFLLFWALGGGVVVVLAVGEGSQAEKRQVLAIPWVGTVVLQPSAHRARNQSVFAMAAVGSS